MTTAAPAPAVEADWDAMPRAHGAPVLRARIRSIADDFVVEEIDGFSASGSGEHLLLTVEKRDMTTPYAAKRIAAWAGVAESAVGYAGLKDRHARTRQRFSVHLPGREAPPLASLDAEDDGGASLRVLAHARHAKKLPRGALAGNRFVLTLREVAGDRGAIQTRLQAIAARGVPNSFGEQRFGRGGDNVGQALAMFGYADPAQPASDRAEPHPLESEPLASLPRRRPMPVRREQRTFLLSAARSALFNRVLAARVAAGSWDAPLEGEVWILDGSRSVFGPEPWSEILAARLQGCDIHPSAPLWGSGALRSAAAALALESAALDDPRSRALRAGLERAGLRQERRATRLMPQALAWHWPEPDRLQLEFALPPGCYATAVLAELGEFHDDGQERSHRSSESVDRHSWPSERGV